MVEGCLGELPCRSWREIVRGQSDRKTDRWVYACMHTHKHRYMHAHMHVYMNICTCMHAQRLPEDDVRKVFFPTLHSTNTSLRGLQHAHTHTRAHAHARTNLSDKVSMHTDTACLDREREGERERRLASRWALEGRKETHLSFHSSQRDSPLDSQLPKSVSCIYNNHE